MTNRKRLQKWWIESHRHAVVLGRLFLGRTTCTEDSTRESTYQTGYCGSGKLECDNGSAAPPATLAEFTLDGGGGKDFYDVSLIDRYNRPTPMVPQGRSDNNCTSTGCVVDLNGSCPPELRMTNAGEDVACKSACEAFGTEQYFCSVVHSSHRPPYFMKGSN
ncbi:hypothetical protein OROMI_003953 [Orobanche minor]